MSEQNSKAATKKFLMQLYKNTKMGADSIIDIMPKVANEELKTELGIWSKATDVKTKNQL